jgi:hypothetical protein
MNYLFIIPAIAIATFLFLYFGTKQAPEIKEEKPLPKFQPRRVVDLSAPTSINLAKKDVTPVSTKEAVAPKKKKKRYYNNKKKPVVAQNAPTEKRPVGRPRKSTE